MAKTGKPADTLTLAFKEFEAFARVDDPIHKDLSTATRHGTTLFVSCDETAGIDRLTPENNRYGNHVHFNLGELVELPDGPDGEMDIEGLCVDGDWLWVAGSHSLTRDTPDEDDTPAEALKALADIDWDPNRAFLARIPLIEEDGAPRPVAADGNRRLAHVKLGKKSALKRWLKKDAHLGRFLDIPCKENGFDIEGLAAKGMRVWLGLRGPVLRAHAVILELELKLTGKGHLKARKLGRGRRYRKHLIPTRGQGIRDLAFDGDDMLILTGPAMAGDGPAEVFRWSDAPARVTEGVLRGDEIKHVAELPYRGADDHPEGLVAWHEANTWLVVYDNPAPSRLSENPARVTADIWKF